MRIVQEHWVPTREASYRAVERAWKWRFCATKPKGSVHIPRYLLPGDECTLSNDSRASGTDRNPYSSRCDDSISPDDHGFRAEQDRF